MFTENRKEYACVCGAKITRLVFDSGDDKLFLDSIIIDFDCRHADELYKDGFLSNSIRSEDDSHGLNINISEEYYNILFITTKYDLSDEPAMTEAREVYKELLEMVKQDVYK